MHFDDRVQAGLRTRLAKTFPASAVTKPYRFNAHYEDWQVRDTPPDWRLELAGLIHNKAPWTIDRLRALLRETQVTRHICIEGWSQIGQWSGVPLRSFLQRVGADLRARYVYFKCLDDYRAPYTRRQSWRSTSWESRSRRNGRARAAAHPHQARLQERQEHQVHFSHQHLPRRILGRPGLRLVLGS
jgi:Oxidoreductase molybdopterin binding domain